MLLYPAQLPVFLPAPYLHLQDDRHDQCLLPGDSGTHSVTDSYDLNSYGSYVDSDEENHEVSDSCCHDDRRAVRLSIIFFYTVKGK